MGKSYCGYFCIYLLISLAIRLPNHVEVAFSEVGDVCWVCTQRVCVAQVKEKNTVPFGPCATCGEFQGHPNLDQKLHRDTPSGEVEMLQ